MNHQALFHNALHNSGLRALFIAWVVPWMPHMSWKRQTVALAWGALNLNPTLLLLSICRTWADAWMTRPGLQQRALSSGFSVLTCFNNRKSDLSWGWAQVDIGWSVSLPWSCLGLSSSSTLLVLALWPVLKNYEKAGTRSKCHLFSDGMIRI